ncbi:hypothetical protein PAXRUDRAFT_832564, partial [Paxillus rubicundulus Ve08.2h10]
MPPAVSCLHHGPLTSETSSFGLHVPRLIILNVLPSVHLISTPLVTSIALANFDHPSRNESFAAPSPSSPASESYPRST